MYWEQSTPYVKELASDESSDCSYGGSGNHVIIPGRYGVRSPGYNHIEVFAGVDEYGIPIFGDEVDLIGHRLQKVHDYSYGTDAACDDRAVAQLWKHDAAKKRGEIETLPNVGLQLLDVVTVTDARAGVSSEIYRMRGIEQPHERPKEAEFLGLDKLGSCRGPGCDAIAAPHQLPNLLVQYGRPLLNRALPGDVTCLGAFGLRANLPTTTGTR